MNQDDGLTQLIDYQSLAITTLLVVLSSLNHTKPLNLYRMKYVKYHHMHIIEIDLT